LPLIDPNAKEHSIATIELWHLSAQKAIGLLEDYPAALRLWADANIGAFGAVKERYPDSVKSILASVAEILEAVTEQEAAE
jgi:hypothetical protein